MNVLVVCSPNYPDLDEVRYRLRVGLAGEHTTFCRRANGDTVAKLIEELGHEPRKYEPEFDWIDNGDAYNNMALYDLDYVVVYHATGSGVTKYFVDHARKSIERDARNSRLDKGVMLFPGKIEVIEKKPKKKAKEVA